MKTSSSVGWVNEIELILIPLLDENSKIFGRTSVPLETKTVIFTPSDFTFFTFEIFEI